jgi:hypothetical protein
MRTREEGAGKQRAGEEELREQIVESREQRAANKFNELRRKSVGFFAKWSEVRGVMPIAFILPHAAKCAFDNEI